MSSASRTTTVPRSNGPTFAEVIATIENGAPLYGPAIYTFPGVYASTDPTPALTSECPISLAAGHDGSVSSWAPVTCLAASMLASGQNGMPVRFAVKPGGRTEVKRDLLFAVVAGDANAHRTVGARAVVERARDDPRFERRDPARGAGTTADAVFDQEGGELSTCCGEKGADHGVRSASAA